MRDAWLRRIPVRCIWLRRSALRSSVCIGPTDPARNGPFAPGAIVVHKALPEEISYKRRAEYSPSMLRITVQDVLAAAEPLLRVSA